MSERPEIRPDAGLSRQSVQDISRLTIAQASAWAKESRAASAFLRRAREAFPQERTGALAIAFSPFNPPWFAFLNA